MLVSEVKRSGGPIPKFSDYHIWKALYSLDPVKPMGRKILSQKLDIGEGSTRTILNMLTEHNLVTVSKNGILLTEMGEITKSSVHLDVKHISLGELTIGDNDCAVRIPKMAKKVLYGCEERDAAIRAGATGATTLVYHEGSFVFPGSLYPVDDVTSNILKREFRIKNEDVLVIGTAKSYQAAEVGAVTASLNIMGGLKVNRELRDILSPRSAPSEIISLAFAIHDLVGGLPVCAKSRDNLGIRIENGAVIDNAYTGEVLEEAMAKATTIRRVATAGPYKGIKVIVTPIELDSRIIAVIGVVDVRSMAGVDNLIRRFADE